MQLQKVAIQPGSPISQPLLAAHGNSANQQKSIDFHYFLQSFIHLLNGGLIDFFASMTVVNYCQRVISAAKVVFSRIIFSPPFDATSPAFAKMLDRYEDQAPLFQERIDQLAQKFWQNHQISRDIKDLKELHRELSKITRQLNEYSEILELRKNPFPIQDRLYEVRDTYQALDDKLKDFLLEKGDDIVSQFQQVIMHFRKGAKYLPKDIQQQLICTWIDLEEVIKNGLQDRMKLLKARSIRTHADYVKNLCRFLNKKTQVGKNTHNNKAAIGKAGPIELSNIGNSCYLDSVVQAFLVIPEIRKELMKTPVRGPKQSDKDYQNQLVLRQSLLQLIENPGEQMQVQKQNDQQDKDLTQMEFILSLFEGPTNERLRDVIFNKHLHPALDKSGLMKQQDAANIVEVLIDQLLSNCKFKWRGHATTTAFPGLEFLHGKEDESVSLLSVPLRKNPANQKLDVLVRAFLGKHPEREKNPDYQRRFDPKDGIVIPGKEDEAKTVKNEPPKKVDEYYEWYKITEAPKVLVVQFKRFTNGLGKDNRPAILPEDGILDFTKYCELKPGETNVRYKIKSMVRHLGNNLASGHYVAESYNESDGKYYHSDDLGPQLVKQISKKEFFSHKDAYILILERLP